MMDYILEVNDEGFLREEAYNFAGKKHRTHPDTGITFHNYFIPNVHKVIECAYNCHKENTSYKVYYLGFCS